jgi:hypothetical protein
MSKQKTYTLEQIAGRQAKAVRFTRSINHDPERADELEAMTPEEYAAGRGLQINPSTKRSNTKMATTIDAEELETLQTNLAEAETALSDVWEEHCKVDGGSLKAALLEASNKTTEIISEYDPDRYIIGDDDDDEDDDDSDGEDDGDGDDQD